MRIEDGDIRPGQRRRTLGRMIKTDLIASIVVFLVALPLCIGVAVAVGVSPGRAFISGIVGGLIVGCIAGSPLQVSGPAAGLFVIVAEILAVHRDSYIGRVSSQATNNGGLTLESLEASGMAYALAAMGFCVFLAGMIQVTAGKLGLGRWFRAVSPAVIQGMLAGIGTLIAISQFHVMLDHHPTWHGEPVHEGWQYLVTMPQAVLSCFTELGTNHRSAGLIGVMTIIVIIGWNRFRPKSLSILPGALIGIVTATMVTSVLGLDIAKLDFAPSLESDLTLPSTLWAEFFVDSSIWTSAIVLAFVASADALLTAAATDSLARETGVKTDFDKELTAQGVGNVLCGLSRSIADYRCHRAKFGQCRSRCPHTHVDDPAWRVVTDLRMCPAVGAELPADCSAGCVTGIHRIQTAGARRIPQTVENQPHRSCDLPDDRIRDRRG